MQEVLNEVLTISHDELAAGAITQEEAVEYRTALQDAFAFRVNWDGKQETPTFSGVDS